MSHVYIEKNDIGATLTTWVYCAMWQLYAAEKTGRQGYINWPQDPKRALQPYYDEAMFAKVPNMYDWYFVQPHLAEPPPRDQVWTWEENVPEVGQYPLMAMPLAEIREFYKKNFKFNAEVESRGVALAAKYQIDFTKTIGITWRGTDCVTDGRPYMPIETYFPFIDDVLENEPDLRIACTAEEETILDPLLARYHNAFKIEEFFSAPKGTLHNPERFSPFSGYERGMQPALMVWLFSKCAHYIKNRSSTGGVASWISDGRIVCLAHDEKLGYSFDLSKAEIRGELFPLVR